MPEDAPAGQRVNTLAGHLIRRPVIHATDLVILKHCFAWQRRDRLEAVIFKWSFAFARK